MNRLLLVLGLILASLAARGDDLLLMPTARRLPSGAMRGELWAASQLAEASLTAGLGQGWEAQVSLDRFGVDAARPTGSVAYYYLSPIADITPGISGGILDAANATADGRRLYMCATMNRSLAQTGRFGYTELTAGLQVGRRWGPMAGFKAPVARGFSLLAEYDGYRFNAGVEGRLGNGAYARIALRSGVAYAVIGFRS